MKYFHRVRCDERLMPRTGLILIYCESGSVIQVLIAMRIPLLMRWRKLFLTDYGNRLIEAQAEFWCCLSFDKGFRWKPEFGYGIEPRPGTEKVICNHVRTRPD